MVKVKNPFAVALVNIADSQDIASFKKIFDYFSPRLKSFLMKSGADEAIAEEIIQETMTIIWTKADYYDPKVASPSTWIYTIARNKKIDILRKTRKAILENIETAVCFEGGGRSACGSSPFVSRGSYGGTSKWGGSLTA